MFQELASIPESQMDRISGFVSGAYNILKFMPNPTGNNPMKIELEYRATGNVHIWLVTGEWKEVSDVGVVEVYPVNPWDK